MISLQKRFLFVHVPKTAGNSLQEVLKHYSEDEVVAAKTHQDGVERFAVVNHAYSLEKHSTLADYRAKLPAPLYASLYKFATIRNPWDRMISMYFSPHRGNKVFDRERFLNLVNRAPTLRSYIRTSSGGLFVARYFGWRRIAGLSRLDRELNFLLRFETLERDFSLLCDNLQIPSTPLIRRNASAHHHYSSYYDMALIEAVRTKFWEEIQLGDYRFGQV